MTIFLRVLALVVGLLGLVFAAGNQGQVLRLVVGGVLLLTAIALVVATKLRPKVEARTVVANPPPARRGASEDSSQPSSKTKDNQP